jgi:uncharacterized protein involved in outer membrane biogenesis
MKKFFLFLAAFIILLGAAGYVALKRFDVNAYKKEIVQAVKNATGRDLSIAGEMKLHISFSPSFLVTDVKLSNPSWASTPTMIQVGRLDIGVSLLPLLRKKIKIRHFLLENSVTNLEIGADGENNWTFSTAAVSEPAEQPAGSDSTASEKSAESRLKGIEIGTIEFKNARVDFSDRRTGRTFDVMLDELRLTETDGKVRLMMKTAVQGEAVTASGDLDPLTGLLNPTDPYHVNLIVQGLNTHASLTASIRNPRRVEDLQALFKAQGADLAKLAAFAGFDLPDFKNFNVSVQLAGVPDSLSVPSFNLSVGRDETVLVKMSGSAGRLNPPGNVSVQITANIVNTASVKGLPDLFLPPVYISALATASDGIFRLSDLSVRAARSNLSGSVTVNTADPLSAEVVLTSDRIDLADLIRPAPRTPPQPPTAVQMAEAQAQAKARPPKPARTQLFSPAPLPVGLLKKMNASLQFDVKQLIAADTTDLGHVTLKASLKDGVFNLPGFKVSDFLSVRASAEAVGADPKIGRVRAEIKASDMPLSRFLAKSGVTTGMLNADVRLDSAGGASVADIVGALNGRFFVNVENVTADAGGALLFQSYLPDGFFDENGALQMKCLVVNVPLKDGIVSSRQQIAAQTVGAQLQINGDVNLKTEKMDASMILAFDSSSLLSAVSGVFSIHGTLLQPDVVIDSQQVMNNALSVGMAYIMGGKKAAQAQAGLTLIEPCRTALKGGAAIPEPKTPREKQAAQAGAAAGQDVRAAEEQLGRFLEGVFGSGVVPAQAPAPQAR